MSDACTPCPSSHSLSHQEGKSRTQRKTEHREAGQYMHRENRKPPPANKSWVHLHLGMCIPLLVLRIHTSRGNKINPMNTRSCAIPYRYIIIFTCHGRVSLRYHARERWTLGPVKLQKHEGVLQLPSASHELNHTSNSHINSLVFKAPHIVLENNDWWVRVARDPIRLVTEIFLRKRKRFSWPPDHGL